MSGYHESRLLTFFGSYLRSASKRKKTLRLRIISLPSVCQHQVVFRPALFSPLDGVEIATISGRAFVSSFFSSRRSDYIRQNAATTAADILRPSTPPRRVFFILRDPWSNQESRRYDKTIAPSGCLIMVILWGSRRWGRWGIFLSFPASSLLEGRSGKPNKNSVSFFPLALGSSRAAGDNEAETFAGLCLGLNPRAPRVGGGLHRLRSDEAEAFPRFSSLSHSPTIRHFGTAS